MANRNAFNKQLLDAAADGDDEAVRDYLEEDADINTQDKNGQTPLILAVNGDFISTVELLLVNGADIGIRDKSGRNAVNYAAGNTNILQVLRAAPNYEEELENEVSSAPSGETESNEQQASGASATQSTPQGSNQEHSEEAIRVIMMGTTGVGKTSFLVGMYGGIPENGFQLHVTDHDQLIELDDKWSQLAHGQQIAGTNTNQTKHYNLELWNSRFPLARFHWIDYGGGALAEPSNKASVRELTDYINNANCLFVCVNGEHLRSPVTARNRTQIRNETKVNLILHYVMNFSRGKQEEVLPIVITISKYDFCLQRIDEDRKEKKREEKLREEYPDLSEQEIQAIEREDIEEKVVNELLDELQQEIEEDIKALFTPWFKRGWLVMICPFTLGKDFGTATQQGDIPTIIPRNYHFPLVFALWAKLREDAWSITEEIRQIDNYLSNVVIESQWKNFNNKRELLEDRLEEILSIINEELIPFLEFASIYKDGELVKLSPIK